MKTFLNVFYERNLQCQTEKKACRRRRALNFGRLSNWASPVSRCFRCFLCRDTLASVKDIWVQLSRKVLRQATSAKTKTLRTEQAAWGHRSWYRQRCLLSGLSKRSQVDKLVHKPAEVWEATSRTRLLPLPQPKAHSIAMVRATPSGPGNSVLSPSRLHDFSGRLEALVSSLELQLARKLALNQTKEDNRLPHCSVRSLTPRPSHRTHSTACSVVCLNQNSKVWSQHKLRYD